MTDFRRIPNSEIHQGFVNLNVKKGRLLLSVVKALNNCLMNVPIRNAVALCKERNSPIDETLVEK